MTDPALEQGWVDPELSADLPGLGLWTTAVHATPGRSPEGVRIRLRRMAERITGGHVVHMRQDPVPWAYRVLWRQVGLDPDVNRPPAERLAVERLRAGEIPSRNRLDDALTVATLETGVPVVAFDAALVAGPLGLRLARGGEPLGGSGLPLGRGRIVIADAEHALATMDGEVAEERGVTRETTDMVLASVQARGVPPISVEEALWTAVDVLCTPA
jgi:DNA/RNA-binding domain of Phe-tRNA-synthetase-like protein